MTTDNYLLQEGARVDKLFAAKHRAGFDTKREFTEWFLSAMKHQRFCCYYCNTSIFDIQDLIKQGKLKSRKTGYGERGPILEIDKKDNAKGYHPDNCVLSCYYCNNDKSYTLDAEVYKEYFGVNRNRYFKILLGN